MVVGYSHLFAMIFVSTTLGEYHRLRFGERDFISRLVVAESTKGMVDMDGRCFGMGYWLSSAWATFDKSAVSYNKRYNAAKLCCSIHVFLRLQKNCIKYSINSFPAMGLYISPPRPQASVFVA
jgi:hypothetical protein